MERGSDRLSTMYSENVLPRLEELARQAAAPVGVEVAWVELKGEGSKCFFRVFIDRESGVGLDDCERVSERLGVLLDVEDPIESSYTLEVSTPGLDRPLWTKKDYERFTGRLARIRTRKLIDERSRFVGRLSGVAEDAVQLEDSGRLWTIPLAVIESGRLEVEEFRPPRSGRPKRGTKAKRRS